MERSEIRVSISVILGSPDFAALHPGYQFF
jgi:hypothetical protein